MNKLFNWCSILILALSLNSACSGQTVQAEQPVQNNVAYQTVLGKSTDNKEVVDFLSSNHCSSAAQLDFCQDVGMALWIDTNQIVKMVYLYLYNQEGFTPYKGELPLGLKFYDTMGAVQYRLKKQGIGNVGLPDEASSPDHIHYWALYKQAGITIIYNSAVADEDANMYAIVISNQSPS
jgi:hypothetical protein